MKAHKKNYLTWVVLVWLSMFLKQQWTFRLRLSLFCDVTRHRFAVVFRYFGTDFWSPSSYGNQTSLKAGVDLMGCSVGYIVGGYWFSRKMKECIRLLERGATSRSWGGGMRKEKNNEEMKRRGRKESRLGTWKRMRKESLRGTGRQKEVRMRKGRRHNNSGNKFEKKNLD